MSEPPCSTSPSTLSTISSMPIVAVARGSSTGSAPPDMTQASMDSSA